MAADLAWKTCTFNFYWKYFLFKKHQEPFFYPQKVNIGFEEYLFSFVFSLDFAVLFFSENSQFQLINYFDLYQFVLKLFYSYRCLYQKCLLFDNFQNYMYTQLFYKLNFLCDGNISSPVRSSHLLILPEDNILPIR